MSEHVGTSGQPLDLSVIIPARNAADTIGAQLEALRAQSWTGSWEVVVADNGSVDRTSAIVSEHRTLDPRIRLVDASEVRGAGAARNAAIRAARGDALAFCDADDVVEPGWVAAIGEALANHHVVAGPIRVDLLNEPWARRAFYNEPPNRLESFAGIFPFAATCNLGVRRDAVEKVGGFDSSFRTGQDIEFCLRLWRSGYELTYVPGAVVQYRYRATHAGLWRRSRQYGAVGPRIARRLAELGAPTPPRWSGLRTWVWLVLNLGRLRTPAGRARWLVVAGGKVGRLEGSIRERYIYL